MQLTADFFDFEHGHFTSYRISLQQGESLVKITLTLQITQFNRSNDFVNSACNQTGTANE